MLKKAPLLSSIIVIVGLLVTTYVYTNNVTVSVTEQINVIAKNQSDTGKWIILANEKKIYISDVSIWALIEEGQTYTVSYESDEDTRKHTLTSIVPQDFEGQF